MFEVRCLVESNKLADALRALMPLTMEPPVVLPASAKGPQDLKQVFKPQKRKYESKIQGQKNSYIALKEFIATWDKDTIRAKEMSAALEAQGFNPRSYYYGLLRLMDERKLEKTETEGIYKVNHG